MTDAPDRLQNEPGKVFDEMEQRSVLQTYEERRRLAYYLFRLASDLLKRSPVVNVRTESSAVPLMACVTVTRQLYPPGDPRNDEPIDLRLFDLEAP